MRQVTCMATGARGSTGSGKSDEVGDSETQPVAGSSSYGTPVGSSGTPRSTPARTMAHQLPGGRPRRLANSRETARSWSICVERVQLQQAAVRLATQPLVVGGLAELAPQQAGRLPIPSLGEHRRHERLQPPRRAGDLAGLLEPPGGRRGSRAATSSGRSRCPAGTPSCRVGRRSPSRAARSPDPAGPRRPGSGSARKMAPNRYAMLKLGIERGREVEQRLEQMVPLSPGRFDRRVPP